MYKRILILLGVIIFSLGLSVPVFAAEVGNGKIEGQVINGTAGSEGKVGNVEVKLQTFLNGSQTGELTTKSDAQGKFTFEKLNTGTGNAYAATINYLTVDYSSQEVTFAAGETVKPLQIKIYETTTTADTITVMTAHTVVYVGEGRLKISDYYLISNIADRSYIGAKDMGDGRKEVLRFPLPAKAEEVQFGLDLMECCVVMTSQALIDTMAIAPGMKEVGFVYEVPASGDYLFNYTVNFPTGRYDLLYQGEGVTVSSDRLNAEEPLNISGKVYDRLAVENLAAGDKLAINFSGIKGGDNSPVLAVALTLVGVAIGGGYIYVRRRKNLAPQPVRPASRAVTGGHEMRRKLLGEIAQLDDDFEAGKIPEAQYNELRTAKKARLIRLRETGGGSDG